MELIVRGGRLIDPGTGTDDVTDILIRDRQIAAVGADLTTLTGPEVLDASGLIVGPGLIDVHSHADSISGQRLQALDGVTTALDLEAGLMPLARAYAAAADEGRPLNYGYSASWSGARGVVLAGVEPDATIETGFALVANPRWQRSSSPDELKQWLALIESELADGGLGIGVLQGYAPHSEPAEFLAVAGLAARAGVPIYTHVRNLVETDPETPIDGSEEVVTAAAETGAAMHHCHVNATSRRHVDRVLRLFDDARTAGSRITVESYPYGIGTTAIGAPFLAPDRMAAWGGAPAKVMVLETGERVGDARRLEEIRKRTPGAACLYQFLDEDDPAERGLLQRALAYPDSIVASDAMPVWLPGGGQDRRSWPLPPSAITHPRTAGTFAKSLRVMVTETNAWTWLEAFRRCSYLPARLIDTLAPSARNKGHLQVGADADLVILDPVTITDNATPSHSTRPSSGVVHLLVGGEFVVRDSRLVDAALPGRPVRGEPR